VCASTTRNVPPVPFGERLTSPSAASGAVATKNIGCRSIQAAMSASMPS
jgi:hypothetical protein